MNGITHFLKRYPNEGMTPLHVTWLMTAVWSATALAAAIDLLTSSRLRESLAAAI